MRSLSSGLMGAVVVGLAVAGLVGQADARGGVGAGAGARAGSGVVHRGAGFGGRGASFGRRFGAGDRFGRGYRGGRYGYGFGYPGWAAYAQYGDGYGSPYPGSFGPAYDPAPPTSIGIPHPPVAPPAIYVLGEPSRTKTSGATIRERRASRKLTARSSDAVGDSGVVSGGPRIIRITR